MTQTASTAALATETIFHDGQTLAIVVYRNHEVDGVEFLSPKDFSLQFGQMQRPAGYEIVPHIHNAVQRHTIGTQEVLFIKRGRIRIDFYSFAQEFLESRELTTGDFVLLAGAGHGIAILEDTTLVEVKNGPFIGAADKGRFEGKRSVR